MWTVTLNQSASDLLFLSLFFLSLSLSFVVGEEEKKGFSSFAYILVGDYVCMRVRTSKKPSLDEYCRQRDMQRKQAFAGSRLDEMKEYYNQYVACKIEKKKEVAQFSDVLLEFFSYFFLFFAIMKVSYIKRKTGLLNEREIIINASTHTLDWNAGAFVRNMMKWTST